MSLKIRTTRLVVLFILGTFATRGATAQTFFNYGFLDAYAPNAQNYIVGQNNMQMVSENGNPASGVSYWCPVNNGQEASLTFQFTFAQPTTSISLNADIAAFNFGGSDYGSGSLWASTDGASWVELENAPTPSYPGYEYGYGYIFNAILPASLTGASDIWIQARLDTSGWDILAQFGRQDTSPANGNGGTDIFELNATLAPEPSSTVLALLGISCLLFLRHRGNVSLA